MSRKIPAVLSVTPAMGAFTPDGKMVDSFPIGPEIPIDVVDLEQKPDASGLTITSRTTGASVSVGYDPAYAAGFDRIFGERPRTKAQPSPN